LFYNVNFPPVADGAAVRGTRTTTQGWRPNTGFATQPATSPSGRRYLWLTSGPQNVPTDPGTDVAANLAGYVSVTPMRADLTAHDALAALDGVF
jgi:5'-nucleotidase